MLIGDAYLDLEMLSSGNAQIQVYISPTPLTGLCSHPSFKSVQTEASANIMLQRTHADNALPPIRDVFPEYFPMDTRAVGSQDCLGSSATSPELVNRLPALTHSPLGHRAHDSAIALTHGRTQSDPSVTSGNRADAPMACRPVHSHGRLDPHPHYMVDDDNGSANPPGTPCSEGDAPDFSTPDSPYPRAFHSPPATRLPPLLPLVGRNNSRDEEKRHICPYCHKRFNRPSSLNIHINTHTGATPYECPKCGRRFSVNSNMRRHYRNHDSTVATLPTYSHMAADQHYTFSAEHTQGAAAYSYQSSDSDYDDVQSTNSSTHHPYYYSELHDHQGPAVRRRLRAGSEYQTRVDAMYPLGLRPRSASWDVQSTISTTLRPATYYTAGGRV